MRERVEAMKRDAVLVEDAAWVRVMGQPILEALPSRGAPYAMVDPFILVHEGRIRLSDMEGRRHQASSPRVRQPVVHPPGVG
jgi:hypothetical protein